MSTDDYEEALLAMQMERLRADPEWQRLVIERAAGLLRLPPLLLSPLHQIQTMPSKN